MTSSFSGRCRKCLHFVLGVILLQDLADHSTPQFPFLYSLRIAMILRKDIGMVLLLDQLPPNPTQPCYLIQSWRKKKLIYAITKCIGNNEHRKSTGLLILLLTTIFITLPVNLPDLYNEGFCSSFTTYLQRISQFICYLAIHLADLQFIQYLHTHLLIYIIKAFSVHLLLTWTST